jgi:hypothetical protein
MVVAHGVLSFSSACSRCQIVNRMRLTAWFYVACFFVILVNCMQSSIRYEWRTACLYEMTSAVPLK